jgi:signal recognition particle subunit SRP54
VKKLGSLGGILSLLPGLPKELKQAKDSIDDRQIGQVEAIIRSMTRPERQDPALIDGARRKRIATGSGTTIQEVNQLLKQFKEAQQMMRSPALFGGGGGKRRGTPPRPEDMGDLASLMPGGADALGELGTGFPDGSPALRGLGAGGTKGSGTKGGKKKKGGGRVTPKGTTGGR